MVRRFVLLAWCGVLGTLAGCGTQKYASAEGKFTAEFPGTPKESVQQVPTAVGNIAAHTVMAEDWSRVGYGVIYADYPPGLVHPGNLNATLDGAVSGMVANSNGTLKNSQVIDVAGHPGREISFEVKAPKTNEQGTGTARLFLVDNRLYQVLVIGPSAGVKTEKQKAFFDSFRLEGETPSASVSTSAAAPPQAQSPAPATTPPAPSSPSGGSGPLAGWGSPVDPAGDCRIQAQGGTATIEVPGSIHNLVAPPGQANAPRIMNPVEGDFVAEVKVPDDVLPTDPPAPGANVAFRGAGLLLWANEGDFIRLERAAFVREGNQRRYILFEHHRAGPAAMSFDANDPGGPITLRLERRGNRVTASFSAGGTNWQTLPPTDFGLVHAQVGVAALNTTTGRFQARFEGWRVGKP